LPEFDARQGRDQLAAIFSIDRAFGVLAARFVPCAAPLSMIANAEVSVILEQLMLGIAVVAVVLLLLPFLLVMAGVGAAMLLWFVACAALLGALVFWLVFPGAYWRLGACSPAARAGHRAAPCR
jgi:hypothetical protein